MQTDRTHRGNLGIETVRINLDAHARDKVCIYRKMYRLSMSMSIANSCEHPCFSFGENSLDEEISIRSYVHDVKFDSEHPIRKMHRVAARGIRLSV